MILRKVILDTNLYIGWMNHGLHEDLMLGPGLVRYLSAVVLMELRVGATMLPARRALDQLARSYRAGGRLITPGAEIFDQAGRTLQRLREGGREVRQASFVNDVLIALSARSIGATLLTADADYEAIGAIVDFKLERA
ncbi:MAG: PIN domain-containing protein [Polyangiaceae bacterium]|nr:PIN domain-containing protein [Polyangiaceae bacterium]